MVRAHRHPDRDGKNHVRRILRVADDGAEADDRERADETEGARHVVADDLRDHRDEDRQQHERDGK